MVEPPSFTFYPKIKEEAFLSCKVLTFWKFSMKFLEWHDTGVCCPTTHRQGRTIFCFISRLMPFVSRSIEQFPIEIKIYWVYFATLCDWFKNLAPPTVNSTNQIQNQTQSLLGHSRFPVHALSSHWFIVLPMFLVIGHCNCFLVLQHSNEICYFNSHSTLFK